MEYTKLCKENHELEKRVAELDRKAQISTINGSNASIRAGTGSRTPTRRTLSANRPAPTM